LHDIAFSLGSSSNTAGYKKIKNLNGYKEKVHTIAKVLNGARAPRELKKWSHLEPEVSFGG